MAALLRPVPFFVAVVDDDMIIINLIIIIVSSGAKVEHIFFDRIAEECLKLCRSR